MAQPQPTSVVPAHVGMTATRGEAGGAVGDGTAARGQHIGARGVGTQVRGSAVEARGDDKGVGTEGSEPCDKRPGDSAVCTSARAGDSAGSPG